MDQQKDENVTIGASENSWSFSATAGFDLTRSRHDDSHKHGARVRIGTTTVPITINPLKSALVIIDMQNYFLSAALGRNASSGRHLFDTLLHNAIPAARSAQMRVIWLNWGLNEQDLATLPPAVTRTFGFAGAEGAGDQAQLDKFGKPKSASSHKYAGLGSIYQGIVHDPDTGKEIQDPGLCLMKGAWNSAIHPSMNETYLEGSKLSTRPDVLLHKNRMSGLSGATSELERFLEAEGITTLFFAGVDTDHCVGGTLQDGYNKGYDCVLLSDACSTTSPSGAQESIEWNVANTWGFTTTCKELLQGVQQM